MLGFPILYFKSTRLMMFQLSGFYCKAKVYSIRYVCTYKLLGPKPQTPKPTNVGT